MLIDLAMLTVVGCLLEALTTKMSGLVLKAAPSFTFAFMITFVALLRWNLKGLVIIPFLACATVLGGHFNDLPYMAAIYDWRILVACCVGLCTLSINVIFFKRFGTKRVMLNIYAVIGLLLLDYLLYSEIFKMTYRLCCTGNPFLKGYIPFDALQYEESIDDLVSRTVDLCYYVEQIAVYNVLGLIISFVGIFVLRSQGVVNNVVNKLIEDKKAADELAAAEYFHIPDEAEDEALSSESNDVEENDSLKN